MQTTGEMMMVLLALRDFLYTTQYLRTRVCICVSLCLERLLTHQHCAHRLRKKAKVAY